MIIAFIIVGLMVSAIVVGAYTYGIIDVDFQEINKRTSMEQLSLSVAIDKFIEGIRYKCVGSAFNNDDLYLISMDFGSDAVQFLLTTHRKKATTFSDCWEKASSQPRWANCFRHAVLKSPFKKDYKNFDELKENLMNDVSLQIKQYNITCKIKDLEKDFE